MQKRIWVAIGAIVLIVILFIANGLMLTRKDLGDCPVYTDMVNTYPSRC